jgi:hypothetical protein
MPRRADPDVDLREALADIRAHLPGMKLPHGDTEPGRDAAAREQLARKLADDEAVLGR